VGDDRIETAEVFPGLWAIPVAIPMPGLEVVHVYAFEAAGGLVLVDLGWSNGDSLASLEAGLAGIGASLTDVRGVLFTHAHGDHYGLAGPVRERSGAWLALHGDDLSILARETSQATDDFDDWLVEAGVAGADRLPRAPFGVFAWEFPPVQPDRLLVGGERLDVPGFELDVLHTPGHSPGHVCFVERRRGFVLTGDHVLALTTPNISVWPGTTGDPLGDYLRSLDAMRALEGLVGLPGHEARLPSAAARAAEIAVHHEEQLAQVLALVAAGAETVFDVAPGMDWSRPWETLGPIDRFLALGETRAHLLHLEETGRLALADGVPLRWRPALAEPDRAR